MLTLDSILPSKRYLCINFFIVLAVFSTSFIIATLEQAPASTAVQEAPVQAVQEVKQEELKPTVTKDSSGLLTISDQAIEGMLTQSAKPIEQPKETPSKPSPLTELSMASENLNPVGSNLAQINTQLLPVAQDGQQLPVAAQSLQEAQVSTGVPEGGMVPPLEIQKGDEQPNYLGLLALAGLLPAAIAAGRSIRNSVADDSSPIRRPVIYEVQDTPPARPPAFSSKQRVQTYDSTDDDYSTTTRTKPKTAQVRRVVDDQPEQAAPSRSFFSRPTRTRSRTR